MLHEEVFSIIWHWIKPHRPSPYCLELNFTHHRIVTLRRQVYASPRCGNKGAYGYIVRRQHWRAAFAAQRRRFAFSKPNLVIGFGGLQSPPDQFQIFPINPHQQRLLRQFEPIVLRERIDVDPQRTNGRRRYLATIDGFQPHKTNGCKLAQGACKVWLCATRQFRIIKGARIE
jgi:hypothetical protein